MKWIDLSTVAFPGLGFELNLPAGFAIGSLELRFYSFILAAGLLLACIYGLRRKQEFGLTENDVIDGVLWIVPVAIICARAYYCAFEWDRFKDNPISVLYIWNGGIAIYGGIIGAAIGIVVYCRCKKISIPAALDITAISFLIGQAIGRWGNFFNREAFGAETENFLRMGLNQMVLSDGTIASSSSMFYYHPTFLYESLWNAAGFALLHYWSKHRKYDGQMALGYVAWYGLGRTFIEGLRTDSLYWGPFRVSQMIGAISCFLAVGALLWFSFQDHEPAKLYVNRVAAKQAEEETELEIVEEDDEEVVEEDGEEIVEEVTEETEEA